VVAQHTFRCSADFAALLPAVLPETFTSSDIAAALDRRRGQGQKIAYCLRHMGAIDLVGKQGNAYQYRRSAFAVD
jgi:hypothetical protein